MTHPMRQSSNFCSQGRIDPFSIHLQAFKYLALANKTVEWTCCPCHLERCLYNLLKTCSRRIHFQKGFFCILNFRLATYKHVNDLFVVLALKERKWRPRGSISEFHGPFSTEKLSALRPSLFRPLAHYSQ